MENFVKSGFEQVGSDFAKHIFLSEANSVWQVGAAVIYCAVGRIRYNVC